MFVFYLDDKNTPMKLILSFAVIFFCCSVTKGQDLVFKMNQFGIAYKDNSSNTFGEAEVKSSDVVITLKDKLVTLSDETISNFQLEKLNSKDNNIKYLYTQSWKGVDENKLPVTFKFTVNIKSREAVVEFGYNNFKSYYFGKYAFGELIDENKQDAVAVRDF